MNRTRFAPALLMAAAAGAAEPAAPADKSRYTLWNPTPVALMRAMNTDRPDTTESPITVDAGHFQIEASFVDYNRDRAAGASTTTWSFGQVNLKAGLLDRTDIQFVFDTHVNERTRAGGATATATANGIGDLTVRLKQNLWGNEGDTKTAFALMPYLKAPTGATELSNGRYEGGLIAPLGFAITEGVSGAVMLQGDVVRDDARSAYYVEWMHTATCGFALNDALGMFVEYVGRHDSGPTANYRASANTGFTYALHDNLILDTGVRIGLNPAAEDFGWYAGVSYRH